MRHQSVPWSTKSSSEERYLNICKDAYVQEWMVTPVLETQEDNVHELVHVWKRQNRQKKGSQGHLSISHTMYISFEWDDCLTNKKTKPWQ